MVEKQRHKEEATRDASSRLPFIPTEKPQKPACINRMQRRGGSAVGPLIQLIQILSVARRRSFFRAATILPRRGKKAPGTRETTRKGLENKPTAPLALLYTYLRYATRGSPERDSAFLSFFFSKTRMIFFSRSILACSFSLSPAVSKGLSQNNDKCCSFSLSLSLENLICPCCSP